MLLSPIPMSLSSRCRSGLQPSRAVAPLQPSVRELTSGWEKAMSSESEAEFKEWVRDVVHVDGAPQILSRYGFKKIDYDGRRYLMAMTREELGKILSKIEGIDEESALMKFDEKGCVGGGQSDQCYPMGTCRQCRGNFINGYYYCYCIA